MPWDRKRGESMQDAYQLITTLRFDDRDEMNLKTRMLQDLLATSGPIHVTKEVQDLIDYFGFKIEGREQRDTYDTYHDFFVYGGNGLSSFELNRNNTDFFSKLRELDSAMKNLSEHIRQINDPSRLTTELKSIRAYLDAFRSFLDTDRDQGASELPKSIPNNLSVKLERADWTGWPKEAQAWVNTICRAIEVWFKTGGS